MGSLKVVRCPSDFFGPEDGTGHSVHAPAMLGSNTLTSLTDASAQPNTEYTFTEKATSSSTLPKTGLGQRKARPDVTSRHFRFDRGASLVLLIVALLLPSLACAACKDNVGGGYDDLYNLEFSEAHRCFQSFELSHPADPIGPVSDAAAYVFSEFDRLHILESQFFLDDRSFSNRQALVPDPAAKANMQKAFERSQQLADTILRTAPNDEGALFATVLRLGLDADYTALVEKRNMASLAYVKQSRIVAERLLRDHADCYDAYVALGSENYLLSQKAAPIRWFLSVTGAQTDKQTGITELQLAASKGQYLAPFAKLLLAVAALRDGNQPRAKQLLSELASRYPRNQLYRQELNKLH